MRRMRHMKAREIEGCQVAYDASLPRTLFDAESGGNLVAADGTVARWEDVSGNGRHVTQISEPSRPIRKSASFNGVDAVRFSIGMRVSGASFPTLRNASEGYIFAVGLPIAFGSGNFMFGCSTGVASVNHRFVVRYWSSANFQVAGRRLDGNSLVSMASTLPAPVAGAPACVSAQITYATSQCALRVNTAAAASSSSWSTAGSATSDTNAFSTWIGSHDSSNTWNGDIGECAAFAARPPPAVVNRLEHSRMRRWRIAG